MTLDAHSTIIKSAMQLSKDISKRPGSSHRFSDPSQSEFQMELQQHVDKVKSHKQRISMLLASSESTSRVVRENGNLLDQQSTDFLTFYTSSSRYSTIATTRSSTKTFSL